MYLYEDPKWKSVSSAVRTIIPSDMKYYPPITWHELLFHLEVEPIANAPHRYKISTKENRNV